MAANRTASDALHLAAACNASPTRCSSIGRGPLEDSLQQTHPGALQNASPGVGRSRKYLLDKRIRLALPLFEHVVAARRQRSDSGHTLRTDHQGLMLTRGAVVGKGGLLA